MKKITSFAAFFVFTALVFNFAGCKQAEEPVSDPVIAKYTVTFDSDGGSAVEKQTVEEGNKATKPADPTKEGYSFTGWYNGEAVFDFDTAIKANITLKAHWTIKTFTVTFDTDGGGEVVAQTVDYNGKATKPADPAKDGYAFAGWYNGVATFDFETTITADVTLKAHWTINAYTVSFNTDGGSIVAAQTVDYNGKATKPADPEKEGYDFAGWYNGETVFDFETAIKANTTLKAHWTIKTFTVTFDTDGGGEIATQTVNYNRFAIKPAEPTKEGYAFAGWYNGDTEFWFNSIAITENITVKAKWDIILDDLYSKIAAGETDITVTLTCDGILRPEDDYENSGGFNPGKDYALKIPAGVTVKIQTDGLPRNLKISTRCGEIIDLYGTLIIEDNVNVVAKSNDVHWGAIKIKSGGSLIMNGGSISNITHGGSVYQTIEIKKGGTFTMTGGSITNNDIKGAVGVYGNFEMSGGIISGNKTNQATSFYGGAGGVTVYSGATFTMTGGTISDNINTRTGTEEDKPTNLYIFKDGTYNNTKYEEDTEIVF